MISAFEGRGRGRGQLRVDTHMRSVCRTYKQTVTWINVVSCYKTKACECEISFRDEIQSFWFCKNVHAHIYVLLSYATYT
jgi:hypothetical protein